MSKKIRQALSWTMHCRWGIALFLLVLLVSLKINGSSVGMWYRYVPDEATAGMAEQAVLLGKDRPIRSDEWCVFTPMALSQYYNDFGRTGGILRAAETDMSMVYAQSIRDWSMVYRPFQLGYLFLGPERGLSFYWCGKLILLFMVSFEFGMLITEKRPLLSLALACMTALAPVTQWWFSTNAFPDMLVYGQGLVLCLAGYMETGSPVRRGLFAAGMSWLAGAYLLVLYPAWQIAFFYVFLFAGIWVLVSRRITFVFHWKTDVPILLAVLLVLGLNTGLILYRSRDTISAVMSTVYPGQRAVTGGGGWTVFFNYAANPLFPFRDANVPGNVCEMAAFYDLFPAGLAAGAYAVYRREKNDSLLLCLAAVLVLLGTFVTAGFPRVLASVTLLSKSPVGRCAVALSYTNMLVLFRACALLFCKKTSRKDAGIEAEAGTSELSGGSPAAAAGAGDAPDPVRIKPGPAERGRRPAGILRGRAGRPAALCAAVLLAAGVILVSGRFIYSSCFSGGKGLLGAALCAVVLACAMVSIALGERAMCAVLCAACLLTGAAVNPVRRGLPDLMSHTLGRAIERIAREDDGKWIAVDDIFVTGNFPVMYGAPTLNSTNTYPNRELWDRLDPEGSLEEVWNRYAHIVVELTDSGEISAENPTPDTIRLAIPADMLPRIGVKYVVSDQNLTIYDNGRLRFKTVFADDRVKHRIYQVCPPAAGADN